jgi:hypothetical protein
VEIRDGDGSAVEVEERAPDARRAMEDEIGDEVGFEAEADTQH